MNYAAVYKVISTKVKIMFSLGREGGDHHPVCLCKQ